MLGEFFKMFNQNNKLNLRKKLLVGTATAAFLNGAIMTPVYNAQAEELDIESDASITVDYETGQILQGEAIDEPLGIASMSKMLVEYIVFEELELGNITWDTEITVSPYAYGVSQDYALSNVPLREGEAYTLRELYEAMAIYSANGATIAIAEAIEGSEPAFVDRMRETVESFGVEDATLINSTGLNNSNLNGNFYPGTDENDENTMSARSVAKITNQIIRDYPEILEIASVPKATFREGTADTIEMTNWNMMLEGLLLERPGVDGLKTGTTDFAGTTFTGTATQDDRRIITVIMGAGEDTTARFTETNRMMDFGFDKFTSQEITAKWDEQLDYKPLTVTNGKADTVNFEPSETLEMLIQPGDSVEENITYVVEWNPDIVKEDGSVEAPITEGMELGRLVANYSGNELGYLDGSEGNSVPLVAKEAVGKANIFGQTWNWLTNFFKSIFNRF